jgi:hypothetical protein
LAGDLVDRRKFLKKSALAAAALSAFYPQIKKAEAVFPGLLAIQHPSSGPPMTNLVLWLKTPISGLNDGDRVGTWPDSSGNSNDFTAGGGQRPHYRTVSGTINSLPVVDFVGSESNFLENNTLDSTGFSAASVFIVARQNADPPPTFWGFWRWNSAGGDPSAIPFTDGVIYDGAFATVRKTVGNPTPSLASPFLYDVISASGSWKARLNSVEIFSTGTNTYQGQAASNLLGNVVGGASSLNGVMAEVLVYSTNLDDTTRDAVELYLTTKYGL